MCEKRGRLIIVGLSALLVMLLCLPGCRSSSPGTTAPKVGTPAPDFTLHSLKGEKITLSQLRGKKIVLNFWATWCSHCRQEMPYFQEAFEEKGNQIKFIAINLGEPKDKVKAFVRVKGLDFTILTGEKAQGVAEAYNVRYIPVTFFIDDQRIIQKVKTGAFSGESELLEFLRTS